MLFTVGAEKNSFLVAFSSLRADYLNSDCKHKYDKLHIHIYQNQVSSGYQWCLFLPLFEAAQEAGRQAQETIEKAADKAANTIKEFGRRVDGKWAVKKNK